MRLDAFSPSPQTAIPIQRLSLAPFPSAIPALDEQSAFNASVGSDDGPILSSRIFAMFKSFAHGLLIVTACLVSMPVSAQEESDVSQENQELRSRIDRLESLVDQLRRDEMPSPMTASSIPTFDDFQAGHPIEHASFETWNLNSAASGEAPTFPNVRLTGFFQADAGWISQNGRNQTAVGDAQDGADFRRARLAATGNVAENVGYMLEMDFAFPGRPSFMDVWGEVRDLDGLQNVRFGQYRNPFGLDGLTSVKELTFIERGLPFAFLPFRQIGVMAYGTSDAQDMTWAVSGFRFPTDFFGSNVGDNGGYGLATRVTSLVIDEGDDVLHLGAAYSVIDPANDLVQYRSQPEFFVAETGGAAFVPVGVPTTVPFFVDTGTIATDIVNLFAGEVATTSGSWHGQGELIYAMVNRQAASTVTFSGVSVQAGYILTGEHRPYDRKSGTLGRVVPHENFGSSGGCGAWEIAGRWSYLDLNDGGINGGQLNNLTAGLNWYLNRNTKFQLNYIHAFLKTTGQGDSDADIIAMRAQVDF
jgi:phosphate-selective porin OprO and OprP